VSQEQQQTFEPSSTLLKIIICKAIGENQLAGKGFFKLPYTETKHVIVNRKYGKNQKSGGKTD